MFFNARIPFEGTSTRRRYGVQDLLYYALPVALDDDAAPPRTLILCGSVFGASALTSSGPTKSLPCVAARACAARTSAMDPRGETPKETAGCSRLAFEIATA